LKKGGNKLDWQIVVLLNIGIFTVAQIFIRLSVRNLPRAKALSFMFLICAGVISLIGLATGNLRWSDSALIVITVGFFNCFGAYCQWRAIGFSLSRTSLFNPLSYGLAMILAGIFLGEFSQWNLRLITGIVLCFSAVFLFTASSKRIVEKEEVEDDPKKWLIFVLGAVIIFGMVIFLMKVFSSSIPRGQFLIYWYNGAFLGSLLLIKLDKQKEKKKFFKHPKLSIMFVPILSLLILGNLATQYWAFELTLASQVLPFISVGTVFLPVLLSCYLFGDEWKFMKKAKLASVIAVIGALLIILP